ncbi:MAG: ABC transporter ATP-binding protein, partial [Bacteroidales bacterium]
IRRRWYQLVQSIPVIGKKRKPFKALKGVSMEIGNGMFGLLGPNGAGKTTLMRIICGILEQSYGKIWISGIDTQEKREELQGLIGYLPQEFGMYENMTSEEYLSYQGILKGIKDPALRSERVEYVLKAVHMFDRKDEKISSYSGGMKQRIGIAQILLHLPRILVVDEPTAGLDPRERIRFRNLLVELSKERVVIFSTHIIEDISSSCNRVAVLDRGEMVYLGVPEAMARTAEGHVWQVEVSLAEFDKLSEEYKIVHHMRDGKKIRVRLLAEKPPMPDAIPVKPLLEDSYLWLLKKVI